MDFCILRFVSKFPWRSWFDDHDDRGHAFDAIEAAKEAIARCLGLHFLISEDMLWDDDIYMIWIYVFVYI